MGKPSNYPQVALDKIPAEKTKDITHSLLELYNKGKPKTNQELKERITEYFEFCERSSIRVGVESLCLSLHISRTTLFNWLRGDGCDEERREIVQSAKLVINAFIEQAMFSGVVPVPSAIFVAKNVLGYRDAVSIEDSLPQSSVKQALSVQDLPRFDNYNSSKLLDINEDAIISQMELPKLNND